MLPQRKRVVDDRGEFLTYKKLLLATGGNPVARGKEKDVVQGFLARTRRWENRRS